MIKHLKGLEINSIYDFDNAFSINELLCKFWEKIEETINISNESIDLLNWIKEQGLPQEVELLLTKLVEDGTLSALINDELLKDINTKVDTYKTEADTFKTEVSEQLNAITHLTDRMNVIQEDIIKAYEKNKIFSLNKGQYNINKLTLKSNVYELKGVVFNITDSIDSTYNIVIEENCIIDELNIKFSGYDDVERLVQIKGNVKIGKINIFTDGQKGINNDTIDAALVLNGDNIYIDDIIIKNFDYSLTLHDCTNLNIKSINIQSFVRGVYIRTCKDIYINHLQTSINSPNATFNPGHNGLLIEESENINIPYINISDCGGHGIRLGATRNGAYSQKDFNFGTVILKRCGRCGFKALTSEDKIIKNINIDELITIDVNYNGSSGDNKDSLRLEGVENVVVGRINAKNELNARSCSNIVYITNAKHILIDSVVGNNVAKEGILVSDERGMVNDLFIKNINIRATDLELIKVDHKTQPLRDIVFSNIYGREFKSEYGVNLLVNSVTQPIILEGYINKGSQTGIYNTNGGTTSLQNITNKLIEV